MPRFPFTPEVLDALPEEIAELFRGLEDTLLAEICGRLKLADNLNEVTVLDIIALRSHGVDIEDIKKSIREVTGISEKRLDELLNDVVARNQAYYDDVITLSGVTRPDTLVGAADIAAIKAQTLDTFRNITASMGFLVDSGRTQLPPAQAYQWALDNAVMQVQSGAISYNQAIRSAVRQLAQSGLKMVDYESGHRDQIDVAARRAVMTGVSQICAKYTEQSAEWLDTPYFEVSAHAGARDKPGPSPWSSHKAWQGRVYSTRDGDIYPNIYSVCGLGAVDGLEGANCRHIRTAWVEGVSERTYTDEQLAHIDDGLGCTFDGKTYTAYEATQMQRSVERTIRKLKREKAAYEAAGLSEDAATTNIRLNRLNAKYKAFSKAAGLPEQPERMRVLYPDDKSTEAANLLKLQRDAEEPIRAAIRSGEYPLTINPEKQARHMSGTEVPGRSVITIPLEELQQIVDENAGNGKIILTRDLSAWKNTEIISAGREIGYTVNRKGAIIKTSSIKIHYSKTGVHAVPYSGRWKK
mgnify:FL=1